MNISGWGPIRPWAVVHATSIAVRRGLARRRWSTWVLVAVCAAAAAWSFAVVSAAADAARTGWGTPVEVHVADRAHRAGDGLRTRTVAVPAAVVPPDAVSTPPDGAVARQDVGPGEIVVHGDLAPGRGRFALAPAGTVVVAVSDPLVGDLPLGVRAMIASDGAILTDRGLVVAVGQGVVHVAVPAAEAASVAAAANLSAASVLVPSEVDQLP